MIRPFKINISNKIIENINQKGYQNILGTKCQMMVDGHTAQTLNT